MCVSTGSHCPHLTSNVGQVIGKVRRRALVAVISDLLGDEADVFVFQTLDPAEIDISFKKACELTDLETGERLAVNPRGLAVHKAKGLECSDVLIVPCGAQRFADSPVARCRLYVAMSRAKRSLTFVVSRQRRSPLVAV